MFPTREILGRFVWEDGVTLHAKSFVVGVNRIANLAATVAVSEQYSGNLVVKFRELSCAQ